MRVGEILVDLGHASPPQVRTALTRQRQGGGHIGTILVAMGAITVDQLFAALQVQRRKEVADCEHTLEHSQAEYGPMHQNTSLAHYDLARALCDAGRAADAVPHAKAAFTGFVASEGYYGNRSRSPLACSSKRVRSQSPKDSKPSLPSQRGTRRRIDYTEETRAVGWSPKRVRSQSPKSPHSSRLPQRGVRRCIERAEKARAVGFGEGRRAFAAGAQLAQMTGDLSASKRAGDIGLGERTAVWRHDARAFFEAARGERDIGGDADIGGGDALRDPIVGRVHRVADHHHLDEW